MVRGQAESSAGLRLNGPGRNQGVMRYTTSRHHCVNISGRTHREVLSALGYWLPSLEEVDDQRYELVREFDEPLSPALVECLLVNPMQRANHSQGM